MNKNNNRKLKNTTIVKEAPKIASVDNTTKKLWAKNVLDLIFYACIALIPSFTNANNTVKYPYFPIDMFILSVIGVALYILKNQSGKELKVNTFFLFLKPMILSIILSLVTHKNFDLKSILMTFFDTIVIIPMYLLCKNPFIELYDRIGKWAIFDFVIMAFTLLLTVLSHANILLSIIIPIVVFMAVVTATWNNAKLKKSTDQSRTMSRHR